MSGKGLSEWHCLLQVAVSGARLLARLSVVGAVARFQEAAEELARMHALNATPDSPSAQVQPPTTALGGIWSCNKLCFGMGASSRICLV